MNITISILVFPIGLHLTWTFETVFLVLSCSRWNRPPAGSPEGRYSCCQRITQVRQNGPRPIRTGSRTLLGHIKTKHFQIQQLCIAFGLIWTSRNLERVKERERERERERDYIWFQSHSNSASTTLVPSKLTFENNYLKMLLVSFFLTCLSWIIF